MDQPLYVEDIIVPLISVPKNNNSLFRYLGSGFYIGNEGYLLTCNHVVDSIKQNENLFAYQLGKKRNLKLAVIQKSKKYDISLCKSVSPNIDKPWPFIDETYLTIGYHVEVYGYLYEPLKHDELPFRQRYLKGYVTGISREDNYPDSFELNIPILFGMSGSPLVCHLSTEGSNKRKTFIAGIVYGSRQSEIVHHTILESENYNERISKIIELGLSYMPEAIFSLFQETGIDFDLEVQTEKSHVIG